MKGKVILLTSDSIGAQENGLGATILETFLTLLKQREEKPAAIFCMNRGVLALTSRSLASLQLAELARAGVPVLACKTCVDHYGIADELAAGEISSMGAFVDLASQHEVVTLG
ncbi:DsrE family protein [Paenibacillus apiarius]|uniref:DsrE family protein n=1 Tax=Paenibacillus apiarius TaxID=46240 RepID=A0ABT4DNI1_9BACL|nr:DsrE family protein [Paenibacillus apiarius]MCY9515508.1 DsrE family protein [Paenibacillus apiarius]MCY9518917.1 DsrE family protein [Paenibacillus apiarius]MCY9552037.1 DsrE family protein [Paenibacillus apiarius]MCY9557287.1 DsrE family protein [Paenibacillus apiarius]MCY9682534.1 DsrE family protein [Paenibacillus apiarius]